MGQETILVGTSWVKEVPGKTEVDDSEQLQHSLYNVSVLHTSPHSEQLKSQGRKRGGD